MKNAPLILTGEKYESYAAGYVKSKNITSDYILGGTGAVSDKTVASVFALKNAEEIVVK